MMNKKEYIQKLTEQTKEVLGDGRFQSYFSQLYVDRLGAEFKKNYTPEFLWRRALLMSKNACFLIQEGQGLEEEQLIHDALVQSAEIYEYLSSKKIESDFDRQYCRLLSAMCYDIAGYQANAACLAKDLAEYKLTVERPENEEEPELNVEIDNYVISHLLYSMRNQIRLGLSRVSNEVAGKKRFNTAIRSYYQAILEGQTEDIVSDFNKAYRHFLKKKNVHLSHLLYLFHTRVKLFLDRSIWQVLEEGQSESEYQVWNKYIKLLTHDFYNGSTLKKVADSISISELWKSQLNALEAGVLENEESFIIQMPTSAGKTFIAELTILRHLTKYPRKKCLYVAPFRALVNEKEAELSKNLSRLGYKVSALVGSYEIDDFQDIFIKDTDVLVSTPEKVDLLMRLKPEYFSEVSLVVVDEGHLIGEKPDTSSRGSLLEFLIIKLKMKVEDIRILFISAVMPKMSQEQVSRWIAGDSSHRITSKLFLEGQERDWEPTRKVIGYLEWKKKNKEGWIYYYPQSSSTFKVESVLGRKPFAPRYIQAQKYGRKTFPKDKSGEKAVALAVKLSEEGNCLIFCSKKSWTVSVGKKFLEYFKLVDGEEHSQDNPFPENDQLNSYKEAIRWYGPESTIAKCIKRGVGIHHGSIPETLRTAIEQDYSRGKLRVLIATTTVGQGINFPIKNLIFHSVHFGRNSSLSVGQFWNIVGRAGRAGKETEGQIIFIPDRKHLNKYVRPHNIESVETSIFQVLSELVKRRISKKYRRELKLDFIRLVESHILNLLFEEVVDTIDEDEVIKEILGNSLFKIQALDQKINLEKIRDIFKRYIGYVKDQVEDPELRNVFGKTGLSVRSNLQIHEFIESHWEPLTSVIESNDREEFLRIVLLFFEEGEIKELKSTEKYVQYQKRAYFQVINTWVNGVRLEEIKAEWRRLEEEEEKLIDFINQALYFWYPWLVTGFLVVLSHKMKIAYEELPKNIKNLPTYLKLGVGSLSASTIYSLGIRDRLTASKLAEASGYREGRILIDWFGNIQPFFLKELSFSSEQISAIMKVVTGIAPKEIKQVSDIPEIRVRGIYHESERKAVSKRVEGGDTLRCERDRENPHDPYAIKIISEFGELGFVPREVAKYLAVEIDLNGLEFILRVKRKIQRDGYFDIIGSIE